MRERRAYVAIGASSVLAVAFLVWLIYLRAPGAEPPAWSRRLPALNASLNFASAVLLTAGYAAIRQQRRERHRKLMLAAVATSALFLMSYIVYHHYQGDTPFQGQGLVRPIYFFILVSHIILSIVGLPLVLTTLVFALTSRFDRHRKIAKRTLPVWLYVSMTGVAVFFFLEIWNK